MIVRLVGLGYDREYLLDLDHVSVTRTYDIAMKARAEDAATHLHLSAAAAQGDGDSIKKLHGSLMEAAGHDRPTDGDAFRRMHG